MDVTGCSESPLSALECLQTLDWEDLVGPLAFKATGSVDGQRSDNPVMPDKLELLLDNGNFNQVSSLIQVFQIVTVKFGGSSTNWQ